MFHQRNKAGSILWRMVGKIEGRCGSLLAIILLDNLFLALKLCIACGQERINEVDNAREGSPQKKDNVKEGTFHVLHCSSRQW